MTWRRGAGLGVALAIALCPLFLRHPAESASVSKRNSFSTQGTAPQVRKGGLEELKFYKHQGRQCLLCPAGQYVKEGCNTSFTHGICAPCQNGANFTAFPNGLFYCIKCQICKPDQEEVSPCTTTEDTQCHCKAGTFCPRDHPCEVCMKCKTRCPEDMAVGSSCQPWSDLQCVPSERTVPRQLWILSALPLFLLLVAGLALGRYYLCNSSAGVSHLGTRKLLSNLREQKGAVAPQIESKRILVPANGANPMETLEKALPHFEREVPCKSWNGYMIRLGLSQNEIDVARGSERYTEDQPRSLLRTWQIKMGKGASINTMLETLDEMRLKLIRESIQESLIASKLYVFASCEAEMPGSGSGGSGPGSSTETKVPG
ncbi:tumor necrosis factor receptor superfamily member 10B isoform X2 [Ornithorhynchus anatinus]|uniref:Uncharacterized protein n=1 Tax=Ornithorhynchus anatinus TaxID=9258 RepID=F7FFA5_ORNAN|nr:tumor necrosis factor receptor superfamily member 10B isoform X2 [Ornithorhynchus anatinus]